MGEKENCLKIADQLTGGDRQGDYGHPYHDFSRTAIIWEQILGVPVTPEQVGLCMIGVKLSRQVNKPKADNLIDMCGYARTIEMIEEFKEVALPRDLKTVGSSQGIPGIWPIK